MIENQAKTGTLVKVLIFNHITCINIKGFVHMIRIGVYSSDLEQKREIKNQISEYLEYLNIKYKIAFIKTKSIALRNITDKLTMFNIVIICDGKKVTYIKDNNPNPANKNNVRAFGWVDAPLNNDKIEDIIFSCDNRGCPLGLYHLMTKKLIRTISYEEIECIMRVERKTIFYLRGNELVETNESVKKIKEKLPEGFFVDCIKGVIINYYNLKRIDKTNFIITTNSDYKIQVNKNNISRLIKNYFKVFFDL